MLALRLRLFGGSSVASLICQLALFALLTKDGLA